MRLPKPNFEIVFDDANKKHEYYLDGVKVPSVTQICGVVDKGFVFRQWLIYHAAAEIQEKSQKGLTVGDAVHNAIHGLITGVDVDVDIPAEYADAYDNGVKSFLDWWRVRDIKPIATEVAVASKGHQYAGRLDFLGEENGKIILFDWKTASGIFPEYHLQIAGYEIALKEQYGIAVDRAIITRFDKKTGESETVELDDKKYRDQTAEAFLAAKKIWDWQQITKGVEKNGK